MNDDRFNDGGELTGANSVFAEALIHELRQPLTGIKASLQLLAGRLDPSTLQCEDWGVLQSQMKRVEEMLDTYQDILDPNRLESRPFSLRLAIAHACKLSDPFVRGFVGQPQLRLKLSLADDLPAVRGSPKALSHALINVLKNAAYAVRARADNERNASDSPFVGQVVVRALCASDDSGTVEVRVSDNGTGILPEFRASIFKPRQTTKAPRAGSGLGLFVARRMLQAVDCEIGLASDDDPVRLPWATTELCIRLPIDLDVPSDAPVELRQRKRTSILVVEDDAAIRQVVCRVMQRAGYSVKLASTGEAGLDLLKQSPPSVLIVDKNLPGCDGVEVARAARASSVDMAIILITGYASAESAAALLPLQIDAYLSKPFDIDDILKQVEDIVARRQHAADVAEQPPVQTGLVQEPVSRDIIVVEHAGPSRDMLIETLEGLGYTARAHRDVALALQTQPKAAGAVICPDLCDDAAQEVLRGKRGQASDFALVLIADRASLDVNVMGILLGARTVLRRDDTRQAMHQALSRVLGRRSTEPSGAGEAAAREEAP